MATTRRKRGMVRHDEAGAKAPTAASAADSLSSLFVMKPGKAKEGRMGEGLLNGDEAQLLTKNRSHMSSAKETVEVPATLPMMQPVENLPADSVCKGIKVTLDNNSMWNEFFRCKTEMILSKPGSRMFPYCRFRLADLEPAKKYSLLIDIQLVDNNRYKWTGEDWVGDGRAERHVKSNPFAHPDSPATGQHWMQNPVSFYKLKLTESVSDQEGMLVLHALHKYIPRLHVVSSDKSPKDLKLSSPHATFTFPQTEFIAVTVYQNSRFAQLKVDYNPFAKGLKEDGSSSLGLKLKSISGKDLKKEECSTSKEGNSMKRNLKSLLASHKPRSAKVLDQKSPLSVPQKTTTDKDQSANLPTVERSCGNARPKQKLFSELIREAHVQLKRCDLEEMGIKIPAKYYMGKVNIINEDCAVKKVHLNTSLDPGNNRSYGNQFRPSEYDQKSPSKDQETPPEVQKNASKNHKILSELHKTPSKVQAALFKDHKTLSEDHKTPSKIQKTSSKQNKTLSEDHKGPSEDHKMPSEIQKTPSHKTLSEDHKTPSKVQKTSKHNNKLSEDQKTPTEDHKTPSKVQKASSKDNKTLSEDHKMSSEDHKMSSEVPKTSFEDQKTPPKDQKTPSQVKKTHPKDQKYLPKDQKTPPKDGETASEVKKTPPKDQKSPPKDQKTPPKDEKTPSEDQKMSPKDQKTPSEVKKTPKYQKTPPKDEKTPSEVQKTSPKDQKSPPKDQETPSEVKTSPPKDQKTPPKDEKTPSEVQKTPPKDQKTPPKDQKTPPKDRKTPPKDHKTPPTDCKTPSEDHETPLDDQKISEVQPEETPKAHKKPVRGPLPALALFLKQRALKPRTNNRLKLPSGLSSESPSTSSQASAPSSGSVTDPSKSCIRQVAQASDVSERCLVGTTDQSEQRPDHPLISESTTPESLLPDCAPVLPSTNQSFQTSEAALSTVPSSQAFTSTYPMASSPLDTVLSPPVLPFTETIASAPTQSPGFTRRTPQPCESSPISFEPLSPASSPDPLPSLDISAAFGDNLAPTGSKPPAVPRTRSTADAADIPSHKLKWHTIPPPDPFLTTFTSFQPTPLSCSTLSLLPSQENLPQSHSGIQDLDSATCPSPTDNDQSLPFPTGLSPLALPSPLSPAFSSLDGDALSPTPSLSDLMRFFSTDGDLGMEVDFSNPEAAAAAAAPAPCPPPSATSANTQAPPSQKVPPPPATGPLKLKKKRGRPRKSDQTESGDQAESRVPNMQPSVEEVEEQLFVSFTSKEALKRHLGDAPESPEVTAEPHQPQPQPSPVANQPSPEATQPPPVATQPPPEATQPSHEATTNAETPESPEERIGVLEQLLLRDLKLMKHRQVIHPVLQEVGLKLNLLDPMLTIDLQWLGVRLPIPPPGTPLELPSSQGVSAAFVSRTGKATDVTQIKGWRDKFPPSESSPVPTPSSVPEDTLPVTPAAPPAPDVPSKNLAAFCSDMLDEYLANEAASLIDERASSFAQAPEHVAYELPVKSASYVRTLDSVLKNKAQPPATPTSALISGFVPPSKRPRLPPMTGPKKMPKWQKRQNKALGLNSKAPQMGSVRIAAPAPDAAPASAPPGPDAAVPTPVANSNKTLGIASLYNYTVSSSVPKDRVLGLKKMEFKAKNPSHAKPPKAAKDPFQFSNAAPVTHLPRDPIFKGIKKLKNKSLSTIEDLMVTNTAITDELAPLEWDPTLESEQRLKAKPCKIQDPMEVSDELAPLEWDTFSRRKKKLKNKPSSQIQDQKKNVSEGTPLELDPFFNNKLNKSLAQDPSPGEVSDDWAPLESDTELDSVSAERKRDGSDEGAPLVTKALLKQKDLEDGVVWEGKPRTRITAERAAISLTSLFTLVGFVSENPTAPIQVIKRRAPPCLKPCCRLGCICASLNYTHRLTHCGRVDCMLGCTCLRQKVVLLKNLDGSDSSHTDTTPDSTRKRKKKRRMKMAYVLKESVSEPAQRIRTLWRQEPGHVDPEPLYTPELVLLAWDGPEGKTCARVRAYSGRKTQHPISPPAAAKNTGVKRKKSKADKGSAAKEVKTTKEEGSSSAKTKELKTSTAKSKEVKASTAKSKEVKVSPVKTKEGKASAAKSKPDKAPVVKSKEDKGSADKSIYKKKDKKAKSSNQQGKQQAPSPPPLPLLPPPLLPVPAPVLPASKRLEVVTDCRWESMALRNHVLMKVVQAMCQDRLDEAYWIGNHLITPICKVLKGDGAESCLHYKVNISEPILTGGARPRPTVPAAPPLVTINSTAPSVTTTKLAALVTDPAAPATKTSPLNNNATLEPTTRELLVITQRKGEGDKGTQRKEDEEEVGVEDWQREMEEEDSGTDDAAESEEQAAGEEEERTRMDSPVDKERIMETGLPFITGVSPAGVLRADKRQPGGTDRLVQVNGKAYPQAKIQLGGMGALHPANRLAAYLTGRVGAGKSAAKSPQQQQQPVPATAACSSVTETAPAASGAGSAHASQAPPVPDVVTTTPTTTTIGLKLAQPTTAEPRLLSSQTATIGTTAAAGSNQTSQMLLIPSPTGAAAAAGPGGRAAQNQGGKATVAVPMPPPSQKLLVHKVTGGAGGTTLLCQKADGKLVQLIPLSHLRALNPNLVVTKGPNTPTPTISLGAAKAPTAAVPPRLPSAPMQVHFNSQPQPLVLNATTAAAPTTTGSISGLQSFTISKPIAPTSAAPAPSISGLQSFTIATAPNAPLSFSIPGVVSSPAGAAAGFLGQKGTCTLKILPTDKSKEPLLIKCAKVPTGTPAKVAAPKGSFTLLQPPRPGAPPQRAAAPPLSVVSVVPPVGPRLSSGTVPVPGASLVAPTVDFVTPVPTSAPIQAPKDARASSTATAQAPALAGQPASGGAPASSSRADPPVFQPAQGLVDLDIVCVGGEEEVDNGDDDDVEEVPIERAAPVEVEILDSDSDLDVEIVHMSRKPVETVDLVESSEEETDNSSDVSVDESDSDDGGDKPPVAKAMAVTLASEHKKLMETKRQLMRRRTDLVNSMSSMNGESAEAVYRRVQNPTVDLLENTDDSSSEETDNSSDEDEAVLRRRKQKKRVAADSSGEDEAVPKKDEKLDVVDIEEEDNDDGDNDESQDDDDDGEKDMIDIEGEDVSLSLAEETIQKKSRGSAQQKGRRQELNAQYSALRVTLNMDSPCHTKAAVLQEARREIEDLTEQEDRLEKLHTCLTYQRAEYIRQIARKSGKSEESILGKLEKITHKIRSLEQDNRSETSSTEPTPQQRTPDRRPPSSTAEGAAVKPASGSVAPQAETRPPGSQTLSPAKHTSHNATPASQQSPQRPRPPPPLPRLSPSQDAPGLWDRPRTVPNILSRRKQQLQPITEPTEEIHPPVHTTTTTVLSLVLPQQQIVTVNPIPRPALLHTSNTPGVASVTFNIPGLTNQVVHSSGPALSLSHPPPAQGVPAVLNLVPPQSGTLHLVASSVNPLPQLPPSAQAREGDQTPAVTSTQNTLQAPAPVLDVHPEPSAAPDSVPPGLSSPDFSQETEAPSSPPGQETGTSGAGPPQAEVELGEALHLRLSPSPSPGKESDDAESDGGGGEENLQSLLSEIEFLNQTAADAPPSPPPPAEPPLSPVLLELNDAPPSGERTQPQPGSQSPPPPPPPSPPADGHAQQLQSPQCTASPADGHAQQLQSPQCTAPPSSKGAPTPPPLLPPPPPRLLRHRGGGGANKGAEAPGGGAAAPAGGAEQGAAARWRPMPRLVPLGLRTRSSKPPPT